MPLAMRPRAHRIRRLLLGLATVTTALGSGEARAQEAGGDRSLTVVWTAPAGCASQAELSARVQGALGQVSPTQRVTARATADGHDDQWHADVEVTVGAQSSVRHVEGETCRAVADAAVVIVALAAGGSVARPLPPPVPPPPASPRAAKESGALVVGASFLVDAGTLPSLAAGAQATVGWAFPRLELQLVGSWLATQKAPLPGLAGQGANITMGELRARACYDLLGARVSLAPCVGGGVEWLVADGFGTSKDASSTDSITVASLGVRLGVRLTPHLSLQLGGEAVVPFTHPTFVIDNVTDSGGRVYQTSSIAGRGTLGVDLRF